MHVARRRHLPLLVLVAAVAALAACGGPAGPAVPNASTVTPGTAERGASVTITGTGFGTTPGTVTIGGVSASTADWSDTSVIATVPGDAMNAWQDVSITTAGGSDSLEGGVFVGVEYDGTGPELQVYLDALEPGTAVLLQAATYDLTAQVEPFIIDNVDLYGRGESETLITAPNTSGSAVLAEFGATTTLSDLSLEYVMFMYLHGTFRDTVTPWASVDVDEAIAAAGTPVARERLDAIVGASLMQPAAANPARFVFDGVTFTGAGPSTWGLAVLSLPSAHIEVIDSTFDSPVGTVGMYTGGDVLIESSLLDIGEVVVLTPFGGLTVVDSQVITEAGGLLAAQDGILVDASTVTASSGNLTVVGAAAALMAGASVPSGGAIEFRGSTVEMLDSDPLDATNLGSLDVMTQYAPIRFIDNVLIRAHDNVILAIQESDLGAGDIDLVGNRDVRVGVFHAESAAGARAADLVAVMNSPGGSWRNRLTVEDNTIAVSGDVQFSPTDVADVIVDGNTIAAGDTGVSGFLTIHVSGEGVVEVTDNDFTFRSNAVIAASSLAGGTLLVDDNSFTNTADSTGIVTISGTGGSCSVTNNTFELVDPLDLAPQGVGNACSVVTPGHTFTVSGNDVTTTGSASSGFTAQSNGMDTVTVSDNLLNLENTFMISSTAPDSVVAGNTVVMGSGSAQLIGNETTKFTVSGNTVTQRTPTGAGLNLSGLASATVTDNSFAGIGAPGAGATALNVQTSSSPMELTVTGNTFTNYSNALHLTDAAGAAHGYTATINGNVFDFVIDAAPKVATLTNIKDTIDATNNQWGTNTDHVTVKGYVTEAGDTGVQGGDIDVNPITQP